MNSSKGALEIAKKLEEKKIETKICNNMKTQARF